MKILNRMTLTLILALAACTRPEPAPDTAQAPASSPKRKSLMDYKREFLQSLADNDLQIEVPGDYQSIIPVSYPELDYGFAVEHTEKELEVRYRIESLRDDQIWDEARFRSGVDTIILRLSGGKLVDLTEFPQDAVKNEFKADYGASAFFELNSLFGAGYKYCQMVIIHKRQVSNAFIFLLANDPEVIKSSAKGIFYSLKYYR